MDLGANERLEALDLKMLDGMFPALSPHRNPSSNPDDASDVTEDLLAEGERLLGYVRRQVSFFPCYKCDEGGHAPRHCPDAIRARAQAQLQVPEQQPSSIGSPPPMVPRSESPKSVDAEVQTMPVPPPRRPTPNPGATRTIIDLTVPEHASGCPNCDQPGPAGPPTFDLANYMDLDMQNQEARALARAYDYDCTEQGPSDEPTSD